MKTLVLHAGIRDNLFTAIETLRAGVDLSGTETRSLQRIRKNTLDSCFLLFVLTTIFFENAAGTAYGDPPKKASDPCACATNETPAVQDKISESQSETCRNDPLQRNLGTKNGQLFPTALGPRFLDATTGGKFIDERIPRKHANIWVFKISQPNDGVVEFKYGRNGAMRTVVLNDLDRDCIVLPVDVAIVPFSPVLCHSFILRTPPIFISTAKARQFRDLLKVFSQAGCPTNEVK